ncbi:3'-5' exonuclease [Aliarcobacter cibarius]|jgi:DNA polymerase III epsilon subunit-like protein|uniref:3'-5' exonuclease n=1 Tax=Aliarcobacter cibarius TaxID=255507 RepID=A0A5J6RGN6_9BACT|nr:3'-5' exonuclease [Aliarcobacter cibarius]QEZ89246.1 DEDDh 3'-5' exonuclease domain family protein [Aliarcobacter cibarius]QKJ27278.1 DEDDh 3'-5' exonuclease domain family protein [Aliarcobacter cibarius]TLT01505.1 3'-5' exonuclease [Aliarcobacter cibarius]TLT01996.1 3'-5' exonuclease [Aliarcobacter cibarius]TLT04162.1 3'-5' exonuclease [Aliarcobacter cibarius]
MTHYILFDTETTGASTEDRVIQFGAIILNQKNEIEIFDELCFSEIPIKLEAMEVHNITPSMIENKPMAIETKFYKRLEELNSNENFLIAHNINFDLEMIKKEGFINNFQLIDTLRCAKHLFDDLAYHRLQYLRYALDLYKIEETEAKKLNITIKAHDAIGDVLVMKLFLSKLVAKCREIYPNLNPMQKLVELTQTPVLIKTFKFGKYKGENIEEVAKKDANYLNWMKDNMKDLDEDMLYSINFYLKR